MFQQGVRQTGSERMELNMHTPVTDMPQSQRLFTLIKMIKKLLPLHMVWGEMKIVENT